MPAFKDWEEEEKLAKSLGRNGYISRNNMSREQCTRNQQRTSRRKVKCQMLVGDKPDRTRLKGVLGFYDTQATDYLSTSLMES